MSEEIIDLLDDLHKMQTLLDFIINALVALATRSFDDNLRLEEDEAYEVSVIVREMVDKMIKRMEQVLKV